LPENGLLPDAAGNGGTDDLTVVIDTVERSTFYAGGLSVKYV
jgi:hypothetical protein